MCPIFSAGNLETVSIVSQDVFEKLGRISFEDVPERHPVRLFQTHWQNELNENGVFLRQSLNPARIPKLLPWVVMVTKEPLAPKEKREQAFLNDRDYRFRYRLCGTEYGNMVGRDLTGLPVGRRQSPEDAIATYKSIEICMDNNRAFVGETNLPLADRSFIKIIRSVFPMSADGSSIDLALSVVAPSDTKIRT